jgi:hypothetical protein
MISLLHNAFFKNLLASFPPPEHLSLKRVAHYSPPTQN